MRAVIWTRYGPPEGLRPQDIPKPTPKDNEVLIRIHTATATAGDCELRGLKLPLLLSLPMRLYAGFRRPKRIRILGQEFAGTIEAVGKSVGQWKADDEVFGIAGLGSGAYAEYMCRPESPGEMDGVMTSKPPGISFQEAAAIPLGGLESVHYLRKADIRAGQKVLIIGAGGSIGTIGVQLAKHFGAHVAAVDSTQKLDMLRAIGADQVIDYTREDFTRTGERYDAILDVVGKTPIAHGMKCLTQDGIYLMANPRISKVLLGRLLTLATKKRLLSGSVVHTVEQLEYLKKLIDEGELQIVIDRCYPLEQTADAHRYVETGNKAGNVIINVHADSQSGE